MRWMCSSSNCRHARYAFAARRLTPRPVRRMRTRLQDRAGNPAEQISAGRHEHIGDIGRHVGQRKAVAQLFDRQAAHRRGPHDPGSVWLGRTRRVEAHIVFGRLGRTHDPSWLRVVEWLGQIWRRVAYIRIRVYAGRDDWLTGQARYRGSSRLHQRINLCCSCTD